MEPGDFGQHPGSKLDPVILLVPNSILTHAKYGRCVLLAQVKIDPPRPQAISKWSDMR